MRTQYAGPYLIFRIILNIRGHTRYSGSYLVLGVILTQYSGSFLVLRVILSTWGHTQYSGSYSVLRIKFRMTEPHVGLCLVFWEPHAVSHNDGADLHPLTVWGSGSPHSFQHLVSLSLWQDPSSQMCRVMFHRGLGAVMLNPFLWTCRHVCLLLRSSYSVTLSIWWNLNSHIIIRYLGLCMHSTLTKPEERPFPSSTWLSFLFLL